MLGFDTTIPVTINDMVHHTAAVRRGMPGCLVVADLPFGEASLSFDRLLDSARRLMQCGADAVKIEGGKDIADDIEKLVNEFSNFARMPRPVLKKINLNDVILRSINFLKISLKSKIFFKENKKKNFIMGDEDQLYRVFINIIKNAEESIIEILNKKPKYEGKIEIDILTNKDYIISIIKDNGEGISDTKKVMTPYFTTKKKGTGLGLPIVNKIINEHSGEFIIKKDKGTTIEIWIPSI